jgi:hypothetical protein
MVVAAAIEIAIGVDAEKRSLERVAEPRTAKEVR